MNPVFLKKVLEFYLLEDAFFGDATTEAVSSGSIRKATIRAKEDFVLAGAVFIEPLLELIDEKFSFRLFKGEGDWVRCGEEIARIESSVKTLLYVERLCLNMIQRMSGIATKTRKLADMIRQYRAKVTDTRKTTPGFRFFEKYAVKVGGGVNHRMGLFDSVLIKDNHIHDAGGVKKAIRAAKASASFTNTIEVECADEGMVEEAIEAGADIVMLDNMDTETMRRIVQRFHGRAIFEASGRINENNIVEVAKTGVDFISIGALTHHAVWVDINMDLE